MADIVVTVKTTGGDYTTLASAEAGEQADLPTVTNTVTIECYTLAAADTSQVTIDGWTTNATYFITITVPSAERHDGKRNTGKYRLEPSTNFGSSFTISEQYVRVGGMAISNTAGTPSYALYIDASGASDIRLSDCIFYDVQRGCRVVNGNVTGINCLAMSCSVGGFDYTSTGTVEFDNCVAVNGGTGFEVANFRTLICKNCYAGGNTTDFDDTSGGTLTTTTCHASDTTGDTQTAFSTSSGAYFTNITSGSEDLSISTSSVLKDAGTSLAGWNHPDGDVDIIGTSWGTWGVGAFEFVAAGGGGNPWYYYAQM